MIRKIISGGQTGADQGALHGATLASVATGGFAPKGWKTEAGPDRELLKRYGLIELETHGYLDRTIANIEGSDGTLVISSEPIRGGSKATIRECSDSRKPFYPVIWYKEWKRNTILSEIINFINANEIRTLNVAGNRESKNPGIFDATSRLVLQLCGAVNG